MIRLKAEVDSYKGKFHSAVAGKMKENCIAEEREKVILMLKG